MRAGITYSKTRSRRGEDGGTAELKEKLIDIQKPGDVQPCRTDGRTDSSFAASCPPETGTFHGIDTNNRRGDQPSPLILFIDELIKDGDITSADGQVGAPMRRASSPAAQIRPGNLIIGNYRRICRRNSC